MNDAKIKQQIVEKINGSTNILVTVSKDPSVDALASAIGLTVMLNKLGKHTTAIFSGAMPPAMTFLDPGKTFEQSIDSLRDFIIAIDKEKADHLRYKVEGESVKIFITPYKTTLSSEDLEFSQGDYNIELVLALGVENQAHLDSALEAHGSILHDAAVITISNQEGTSSLGSIDWRDNAASSLSEMMVNLTELLQSETPLVDAEVATALLTGIVAETDRFSNPKTSSKVMTIAAQLMAAGADQQLIATKLQESHEIGADAQPAGGNGYTQPLSAAPQPVKEGLAIDHVEPVPAPTPGVLNTPGPVASPTPSTTVASAYAPDPDEGVAQASTTPEPVVPTPPAPTPEPAAPPVPGKIADAYAFDPEETETQAAPTGPAPLLGGVPSTPPTPVPTPEPTPSLPPLPMPPTNPEPTPIPVSEPAPTITPLPTPAPVDAPSIPAAPGITPPAETNQEISKHSYLGGAPSFEAPVNGTMGAAPTQNVDIFANVSPAPTPTSMTSGAADPLMSQSESDRDEAARNEALAEISAPSPSAAPALSPIVSGFSPAPGITLPPPPPVPDFTALPAPAATSVPPVPSSDSPYSLDALPPQPSSQPEILGDILAPTPAAPNDPGQFKIPGQ